MQMAHCLWRLFFPFCCPSNTLCAALNQGYRWLWLLLILNNTYKSRQVLSQSERLLPVGHLCCHIPGHFLSWVLTHCLCPHSRWVSQADATGYACFSVVSVRGRTLLNPPGARLRCQAWRMCLPSAIQWVATLGCTLLPVKSLDE